MSATVIHKKSKQRDAILSFLQSRMDHPTADTVYMNVKKEYPNISLGTVYRNLTQLSEEGVIGKLSMGGTLPDRFDPDPNPHYHFVCQSCGCVRNFGMDLMPDMNKIADEHFKGKILSHVMFFYGYCENCLKLESSLL